MPRYDRLTRSPGYNAERHPRSAGGDCLVWYFWNGEPGDDLDCVRDDAAEDENGGQLVGWVAIDHSGRVFARFDGIETEIADGSPRTGEKWIKHQNEIGGPGGDGLQDDISHIDDEQPQQP